MPKLPKRLAIRDYEKNIAYIPLGRYISHGFAIIDLDDADRLQEYYWHTDTNGYPISGTGLIRGAGNHYMHRFVLPDKKGFTIDHINRNVKDSRRCNLRYATPREQMQNRSTHNSKNRTSKYKGVSYVKNPRNKKNPWQYALYSIDFPKGKIYGYVDDEKEAALKYNELALKYQGDRAVLNVIE